MVTQMEEGPMTPKRKGREAAAPAQSRTVLAEYDASALVGLRTVVQDAVVLIVDAEGEECVHVPNLRGLEAAAAVRRCLVPVKLRGAEIRAMRKIMRLTLAALAERMDAKTAPETISRWETESQPMGGYAEKIFRLLVCDALHMEAPAVDYDGSKIAQLRVVDPWVADPEYRLPELCFQQVRFKERSGPLIEAYAEKQAA
jgi:DNA-binding transcriptional regulator YiaG